MTIIVSNINTEEASGKQNKESILESTLLRTEESFIKPGTR